jgi:hypothetical protein
MYERDDGDMSDDDDKDAVKTALQPADRGPFKVPAEQTKDAEAGLDNASREDNDDTTNGDKSNDNDDAELLCFQRSDLDDSKHKDAEADLDDASTEDNDETEDGDTYSAVGVRYGVAAVVAKKAETVMSVMT